MTTYFVDTSALAKRYVIETGSNWVRSWILPGAGNTILISRLTTVEMIALLMRRQRDGTLSPADITRLRNSFFAHVRGQYSVIEFETRLLVMARSVLVRHPLRTLDALQLGSAVIAKRTLSLNFTFISGDHRLLSAATAEGFTVDDPNLHP